MLTYQKALNKTIDPGPLLGIFGSVVVNPSLNKYEGQAISLPPYTVGQTPLLTTVEVGAHDSSSGLEPGEVAPHGKTLL